MIWKYYSRPNGSFAGLVLERDGFCIKILLDVLYTWMCLDVAGGVGELESECQGWARDSSSSQETELKIQYRSRIDFLPSLLKKVQDARKFLTHLPSFFLFFEVANEQL